VRDNLRHRADIEEAYLEAIGAANEEIILAAAYFFPGVRFCHALVDAAARGVRVMLLLQARVEYMLLHYASRAIRTALAASEYFILFASERAAQSASPRALTQACR
jgi:cardiolipin synthase